MRISSLASLAIVVLLGAACGDDGSGGDASTDTGMDTGSRTDTGADTSADTGIGTDGSSGDGGIPVEECFAISLDGEPLAIPDTFDDSTPTWRRPFDADPVCPATDILPGDPIQPVPYVAYAFCNEDTESHTLSIEMLADDDGGMETPLDDPFLVVYSGQGVPADVRQCSAINDDTPGSLGVNDAGITDLTIDAGEAITVVGTAFQWTLAGPEGRGHHIIVVTTDP
jgi:hypothetical protein